MSVKKYTFFILSDGQGSFHRGTGGGGGAMEGLEKQHQGSKAGLAGFWSLSLLSNTVRAPDPLKVKFSRPELSQKEIFLH